MPGIRAIIVSYDIETKQFDSLYERNKFYRGLFGFKQEVHKKDKTYVYHKKGLLGEIPHVRMSESVLMIPEDCFEELEHYFKYWRQKVVYHRFRVVVEKPLWDEENG